MRLSQLTEGGDNTEAKGMHSKKRLLYIQYTNPAGFPPLEHSSYLFAERGWDIVFLGINVPGVEDISFPPHDRIHTHLFPACQRHGLIQKAHFVAWSFWAVLWSLVWRPGWIYVSDSLACPAALVARSRRRRIVYHEHDGPVAPRSPVERFLSSCRAGIAARAAVNVLPNETRAKVFVETLRPSSPVVAVLNCPSIEEAAVPRAVTPDGPIWLAYHGSIVPGRLPISILEALSDLPTDVGLRIAGYETLPNRGYLQTFLRTAHDLGVADRVEALGVAPTRAELLAWARDSHIGLALMPKASKDLNEEAMAGASNKAFDYLACGLPVVISDLPDWRALFEPASVAVVCDPDDPRSIADAIGVLVSDRRLLREMGERGRQRILEQWNYEAMFAPILTVIEGAQPLASEAGSPATR